MKLPTITLLEQRMDRKDFLRHIGIGAMLLLGGNMIMHALNGAQRINSKNNVSLGYGSSLYGGR